MTVWWFLAAAPVAARLASTCARSPRLAAPLAGRFLSDEDERPASGAATDRWGVKARPPSPGTPGEGRGEGFFTKIDGKDPHPNPLPEYREREKDELPRFHYLTVGDRGNSDPGSLPTWRAAVALAAILTVCVGCLPWLDGVNPIFRARPSHRTEADLQALVPALAQSSPGVRVFSRMEWSNYLAWATAGRAKVFVEGHVELYPDPVWSDFTTVNDARPGWRGILNRYDVNYLVLDPTYHARLLSDLRRADEWRLRTVCGGAVLFERRRPPSADAGRNDF